MQTIRILIVIWAFALIVATAAPQSLGIETCSVGQPTTGRGLPDQDADGVHDAVDNCVGVANPGQRDSDGDSFGNCCDADLNNDGMVNSGDLALFKEVIFSADSSADFDGDGVVSVPDLGIMRSRFHGPPGPNGYCLQQPDNCSGPAYFEMDDTGEVAPGSLFVFQSNDPSVIYHARRLISGASICNTKIIADTFLGAEAYNSPWSFHIGGRIEFFGNSHMAPAYCDMLVTDIEANLGAWCPTRSGSYCQLWCPWRSRLVREVSYRYGP